MSADENLSFDLSGIADGDFNSTNLVYRSDSNLTIHINLDDNTTYWVNFSDFKLYELIDGTTDFLTTTNTLSSLNLDVTSTNFITASMSNFSPSVTPIYDHFRRSNFTSLTISFDVNDTEGDDVNISMATSSTSTVTASISPTSIVGGNGVVTITVTQVSPTAIGNTHLGIGVFDAYNSTIRDVNIDVDDEYDIIINEESSSISGSPFTGTLYAIETDLDYNNSQEVEIEKFEIVNSAYSTYTEIEDINGTVSVFTETEDMPVSFEYNTTVIDYSSLTSMYSAEGMPFTFSDVNSTGNKAYATFTADYIDTYHTPYGANGTYSSLDSFMSDHTAGKTTRGVARNKTGDKLLVLDENDDFNASTGSLIELNEDGTTTGNTGTWSKTTVNTKEVLELNTSALSGYYEDEAYILDGGVVMEGEYIPAGSIYSLVLLNKNAKDEIYYSISPNPKRAFPLVASTYTYVSLSNSKNLCDSAIQSTYSSLCDQNNTLESIIGSNTDIDVIVKYEEGWQYWDSNSSLNVDYGMNRFSMINPLEGLVVKASTATKLLLPYDDDADQINDYLGMFVQQWYLLSNNKDQTLTEIKTAVSTAGKAIEYMTVYRADGWHIYTPVYDSLIDSAIPRITEIKRHENYWIRFQ